MPEAQNHEAPDIGLGELIDSLVEMRVLLECVYGGEIAEAIDIIDRWLERFGVPVDELNARWRAARKDHGMFHEGIFAIPPTWGRR